MDLTENLSPKEKISKKFLRLQSGDLAQTPNRRCSFFL